MLNIPLGFRFAAAYAGIRKQEQDDIALIVSDPPAQAAAVFTQNMVQASPVRLARAHLRASGGKTAAILVNAGNANCATRTGDRVALASCKAVAKALKSKPKYILPASTGVIGVELDSALLTGAIPGLASKLSPEGFHAVAQAILTTDLLEKVAIEDVALKNGSVRIAGMTKGSGMIHPNMATTLGFVLTDAAIPGKYLSQMLGRATNRTYNSLSVDGDTSTNDMIALLANGASGVRLGDRERIVFEQALTRVMESLARQIAADGEGAKKLITITARGFRSEEEARQVARSIANSPLVKTAIGGSDPNWGRIIVAAGYSGVQFNPLAIDIYLQQVAVCRNGLAAEYDEPDLKKKLNDAQVSVEVVLRGRGKGEARFFTCDFTEGYIQINGSYRT